MFIFPNTTIRDTDNILVHNTLIVLEKTSISSYDCITMYIG